MSNLGFLALGYGLIWVVIAAYVWFISHRQSAGPELDDLKVEVQETPEKLGREQGSIEAGKRVGDSAALAWGSSSRVEPIVCLGRQ